ncbi:protein kinase domain-containing protein [Belnapia rosea]|uniref:protein kinase domain-containing protein n=1 Tax=Belnapia rosea TaxID=938405 RepID=UPI00087F8959|nr:protein kinase [Belnapia rosea]SDB74659.1 Serine/threonine protein kinase [Belnapia rosea]
MRGVVSIRRLGSGGFGNVDLVQDATGRQFARKTFSVNQPLSAELIDNTRRRFIREIRIQGGLNHRNIVPVLESDLTGANPSYLMPLASGSLSDEIERDRTLGGKWRSAVMDIIAGLDELHSLGMFHRDLKPQNVLQFEDPHTQEPFYAISDFGFISIKDSRVSELTRTGMAKGPDFYTAPEIIADLRNASTRSDIYSLGCIIHDLVGTLHYGGVNRLPCQEIRERPPFSDILLGCTRQDPKRRFQTVRSLADALLSVDEDVGAPTSPQEEHIVAKLAGGDNLELSDLNAIIELCQSPDMVARRAIFMKLDEARILHMVAAHPDEAEKIGIAFARWVSSSSFNFDFCDPLANRLEGFFQSPSLDLRVDCLLALLELGTSHNRWYVEHKFFDMCGPALDPVAARRLAIEFRATDEDICEKIMHLERSIRVSRTGLHPALVSVLAAICPV